MNYYPFHIGDFRSGTANMSRLQRAIYRDLIDICYDTEKPLPLDMEELHDAVGANTAEEQEIVARLLRFKFVKKDDGYHHEICEKVIAEYHAKAEVAKTNGKKSAATRYQNGEYMPTPGSLYAVRINANLVKVGVSGNLKSRVHQLRGKYGKQATLIHQVNVSHMGDAEADLLEAYQSTRAGEELPVCAAGEVALFSHMDRIAVAYSVASRSHTKSPTNQEPITNNQEPKEKVNTTVEADAPTARRRTDAADGALEVFEYWQQAMNHQSCKLDAKRVKAIKGRLADGYTVAQLCRAVDGCKLSPHHQGKNDTNTVYDDIELICRDGPKVDNFRKIAERGPGAGRTANAQQTIDNLQAYLNEHEN